MSKEGRGRGAASGHFTTTPFPFGSIGETRVLLKLETLPMRYAALRIVVVTAGLLAGISSTGCHREETRLHLDVTPEKLMVSPGETLELRFALRNVSSEPVSVCPTWDWGLDMDPGGRSHIFTSHSGCSKVRLEPGEILTFRRIHTVSEKHTSSSPETLGDCYEPETVDWDGTVTAEAIVGVEVGSVPSLLFFTTLRSEPFEFRILDSEGGQASDQFERDEKDAPTASGA